MSVDWSVCHSIKKIKNVLYISFWTKENLFLKELYKARINQLLLTESPKKIFTRTNLEKIGKPLLKILSIPIAYCIPMLVLQKIL